MPVKSLRSANIFGQRILMRVDFNVPIEDGKILDDFRIQRTLPTIQFLTEKKAKKIILITHLGQPKIGEKWRAQFTLQPVANHLEELLGEKVYFITTQIGKNLEQEIKKIPDYSTILLENIRFYKGEKENDKSFAKELAKMGDIFINEAFSVSHRKEASLCAITEFLPSYEGILFEKELVNLNKVLKRPEHPFVLILGGVKAKDKISIIEKFKDKADYILLGGVMANTVLKANDFFIGKSLYDNDAFVQAKKIEFGKTELILPGDFEVLDKDNKKKDRQLGKIAENDKILDIGSIASNTFSKIISKAKTILFNGPMGKFEDKRFGDSTKIIIDAILSNHKAQTIIGGGDTLLAFKILKPEYQVQDTEYRFFSTGGGAMLKYLAGEDLPGLLALKIKN